MHSVILDSHDTIMTLTDNKCDSTEMEKGDFINGKSMLCMADTLRQVVSQADRQGRLVCGVEGCARMLEIDPYNCMLCVLPLSGVCGSEVSLGIHHMLIEAFCREYHIRLVKVDNLSKMSDLINGHVVEVTDNGVKVTTTTRGQGSAVGSDTSCLIIQYPEGGASSPEDELINQFYKDSVYASDSSQACHIQLPDTEQGCHIPQPD